jgi:predicted deacylase
LSRVRLTIDLQRPGRQFGDLLLPWSDNRNPLGRYAVPIITLSGGPGPCVLILGGVHGDEFEGPTATMRLAHSLDPAAVRGRLVLIPAANYPAFAALSRCSPLDGGNLNRAFPGDPNGGPTAMIADWLQTQLIPQCDAVIDLHSGGQASVFVPCVLPQLGIDARQDRANLALAHAMGLPVIWQLGAQNDNRSVNAACARVGVPCIAAELGGGGGVDPVATDMAEAGLRRVLRHLGVQASAPPLPEEANGLRVEVIDPADHVMAPARGLFDRRCRAGDRVAAGDLAGWLHFPDEPSRPALPLHFQQAGLVLAHTVRGSVDRAEMLALVARVQS